MGPTVGWVDMEIGLGKAKQAGDGRVPTEINLQRYMVKCTKNGEVGSFTKPKRVRNSLT